jgi:hypothetical protein
MYSREIGYVIYNRIHSIPDGVVGIDISKGFLTPLIVSLILSIFSNTS